MYVVIRRSLDLSRVNAADSEIAHEGPCQGPVENWALAKAMEDIHARYAVYRKLATFEARVDVIREEARE